VLLDTEPSYTEATAAVAARFGKVYDWAVKSECIGRGTLEAARIIVDALALPLAPEALITERDVILRRLFQHVRPMPGAEAFTAALSRRQVAMAIATSTEAELYEVKAARHVGWLSAFRAVVCGDDPRVRRPKPAPDIFVAAARDLDAEARDCVVFEDSPFGVEAALAAGMQVVALPDPAMDSARYAGAHAIVRGFADIDPEALGL